MERIKIFSIFLFFLSCNAYSYDFSYLEKIIPSKSYDMYIYEKIKDVISNSVSEKKNNETIFVWDDKEVNILEDTMSKTRYGDPDTVIIYIDKKIKIRISIAFNEKHNYYRFSVRGI